MTTDLTLAAIVQACTELTGGAPAALYRVGSDGQPELLAAFGDQPADVNELAVRVPLMHRGALWGWLGAAAGDGVTPDRMRKQLSAVAVIAEATIADAMDRQEQRSLGTVAELVVAGAQARSEVQALAAEHAALRRVAERVARDAPADEILEAVAREAAQLAGVDFATVLRFEPDGATEVIVLNGGPPELSVGMRAPAAGDGATQRVWRSGRAARADDLRSVPGHWPSVASKAGWSSSAAAPIHLNAALWGVLVAVARDEPLPPGIEAHLSNFSELAGTAIAAVQARRELQELAREQAALRRVAELVAHGAPLEAVFEAIATEASALLADRGVTLSRYFDAQHCVVVASCDSPLPIGAEVSTERASVAGEVLRTGRPVRVDDDGGATVTVPVAVEGSVWGTLGAASRGPHLPADAEQRLTHFADLAAAAIANTENKAKLTASRARVVAAADETRRRVQRDVHDTAQQRLVHAIIALQLAGDAVDSGGDVKSLIAEALRNAQQANRDIRDIVRGILPAALTRGGLAAGLETLVDDLTVPVLLKVNVPRLATAVETTAYFVVAEALTNVAKHAEAHQAEVRAELTPNGRLIVEISDDGRGGADATRGTGLTGLVDRVEASGGTMSLTSTPGGGTSIHVEIPVDAQT